MQIPDNSAFCPGCGNKIEAAPVAPVAAPVVPVAPVAAPVEPVAPVAAPVEPVAPVAPVASVAAPVAPVAPVAAPVAAPVEPVAPVAPVEPVAAPVAPVAPVAAPVYPVAPAPQQPQKKNVGVIIAVIATVVLIATAAVLYFCTDLFGGNDTKKDKKKDEPSTSETDPTDPSDPSGIEVLPGGMTTAPAYPQTTISPSYVPTGTTASQPNNTLNPSAGYITRDDYGNYVYYNQWANMMYGIDDTWTEGTEDEYASFENQTTACGLYLKRTANGVNSHVLTISFEMLTGNNTSITVEQYMANVCQGLISSYSAAGVTYEVGDLKTLRMCGETWSDFTVSLNNGAAYQRCIARRQGDCVIMVSLTARSESELNSMLYGFTTIN